VELSLAVAESRKTAGNHRVHWKDVVRVLLFWIGYGDNFRKLGEAVKLPKSTVHEIIVWALALVCSYLPCLTTSALDLFLKF